MDMRFLYVAIAVMAIVFVRDLLKRFYDFDMDNVTMDSVKKLSNSMFKTNFKTIKVLKPEDVVINKNSGVNNLVLVNCGTNKATVMATLRQITDLDYKSAKLIVDSTPFKFMTNVSDKEADLTKKALEFVGAKVEIQ